MIAARLNDRALIRLTGGDVRGFLQALVTNDMLGPLPVWTALLSPQGKCLFDFIVWPADDPAIDDVLIDCEAVVAESLVRRLTLYRLRRAITIALDPDIGVFWAPGPQDGPHPDPRLSALGQRWIARVGSGADDASAQFRAHRLSLGVAEGTAELGDGTTLWLECNSAELNGVSFTKGCYVGQENTARMNWRSTVNRRLCVVPMTEADDSRQRAAYPELGWSVEHRRVDDIPATAWRNWMGAR